MMHRRAFIKLVSCFLAAPVVGLPVPAMNAPTVANAAIWKADMLRGLLTKLYMPELTRTVFSATPLTELLKETKT